MQYIVWEIRVKLMTEHYIKLIISICNCLQIVREDNVVDLKSTERLLNATDKPELKELLDKYDIVSVEVS